MNRLHFKSVISDQRLIRWFFNSDLLYRFFQVWTDFATDRDFAALDFLDHELLGDGKPERPYNETVDFGLEKLVLQFLGLKISPEKTILQIKAYAIE